jgi:trimeric autotransporter adhesin
MKRWLALGVSWSFLYLVVNNRRSKPQTKKEEMTRMKTVIETSIGKSFLRSYFILTAIALGLLALCPRMQAVIPPPGGGYPGANTAAGDGALLNLTTGDWNTAIGFVSLTANTTGQFNTGVGAGTLYRNTGDQITASGALALFNNTTGQLNTATGAFALFSNTTGQDNTANGASALVSNTIGSYNTALGRRALAKNTIGVYNTAVGSLALENNTTGQINTAIGEEALNSNIQGVYNTASGFRALAQNTIGSGNTADGAAALFSNTRGENNTAVGTAALEGNTNAANNTAVGEDALYRNTTGDNNTAIGHLAGFNSTTGSNNVYIGAGLQGVAGESDTCRIKSIFGQNAANGSAVFITSGNKLGTMTSSARFKDEIRPMAKASETLFALNPVTFRYKKEIDPQRFPQFGLVAEEVEKVNPDLVIRDDQGRPQTVRYEQVNAMLLNEFLKEHKKVEEQQATITELKSTVAKQEKAFEATIAQLAARLKEQDSKIQKVSDQVEASKTAPQVVLNNQ